MKMISKICFTTAFMMGSQLALSATHNVSTWQQLRDKMATASNGDVIVVASGTYKPSSSMSFSANDAGGLTPNVYNRPIGAMFGMENKSNILIRGASAGNRPKIQGLGSAPNYQQYGMYFKNCNGIVLKDLIIEKADKGVVFDRSDRGAVIGLEIRDTQAEALHVRDGSDHFVIVDNTFKRIGLGESKRGEAVYVGSDKKKWHVNYLEPNDDDWQKNSDYTVVEHNTFGPDIGADHVDIKEGTKGTKVRGNTFIAKITNSHMTGDDPDGFTKSIVYDKGKDGVIMENSFNMSQALFAPGDTKTAIRVQQATDCPEDTAGGYTCSHSGNHSRIYENNVTNAGSAYVVFMPSHGTITYGCNTSNTSNIFKDGSGSKGTHNSVSGGSCWDWENTMRSGKTYKIINRGTGRALNKESSSSTVKGRTFENVGRFKWKAVSAGGGWYYLENKDNNHKLRRTTTNTLQTHSSDTSDRVKFKVEVAADGSFNLKNKGSNHHLYLGSWNHGTSAKTGTANSTHARYQWYLVEL